MACAYCDRPALYRSGSLEVCKLHKTEAIKRDLSIYRHREEALDRAFLDKDAVRVQGYYRRKVRGLTGGGRPGQTTEVGKHRPGFGQEV